MLIFLVIVLIALVINQNISISNMKESIECNDQSVTVYKNKVALYQDLVTDLLKKAYKEDIDRVNKSDLENYEFKDLISTYTGLEVEFKHNNDTHTRRLPLMGVLSRSKDILINKQG